jgi:hypothetical protein
MSTVRDRLWYWGLGFRGPNPPTYPLDYLGVPNGLVIIVKNQPEPPFEPLLRQLTSVQRVVWSVLGESLSTRDDLEAVTPLAAGFPNLVAGIMDDFFTTRAEAPGQVARFTLARTREIRDRLHGAARPLDLWVVLYAHQLDWPVQEHLALCDLVTFWTWWAKHLPQLEENFTSFEAVASAQRKILGCYLWDWGDDRPLPLDLMQHQCRCGLEWLQQGRIEGMIFLPGPHPLETLETAQWVREWVKEVGDGPL